MNVLLQGHIKSFLGVCDNRQKYLEKYISRLISETINNIDMIIINNNIYINMEEPYIDYHKGTKLLSNMINILRSESSIGQMITEYFIQTYGSEQFKNIDYYMENIYLEDPIDELRTHIRSIVFVLEDYIDDNSSGHTVEISCCFKKCMEFIYVSISLLSSYNDFFRTCKLFSSRIH
ncbi:hypothetical protein [Heterosigma akashiwo virus 01]|uniref:Uncharacterized protein n=1 Tax=Heterosigma akashiwo virus 01 TaxID=97195 RepID=A0A1C9C4Y5_HAV01|nr:hypothetical protein D1R72_gp011 [Heterosigma akashiwo virus 01]AOM63342.1 hypothetical protein [Heterosigma akashiwo virus 01]